MAPQPYYFFWVYLECFTGATSSTHHDDIRDDEIKESFTNMNRSHALRWLLQA